MKITYDEILNTLKEAYFEKTGENVETLGDLSARFHAVASELYSLSAYADFVLRQAFVQTACGEYLDKHASLRNITRKTESKAVGELTFYLDEPAQSDTQIPQGTVCSSGKSAYIQFSTTENAVIPAGELSVTVPAKAVVAGASYNAKAGEVMVMVTPPAGVSGVINENDFEHGSNTESDTALRQRVLNSYRIAQTGMNLESIQQQILKIDGVLDTGVLFNNNTFSVWLKTKTGVTEQIRNEVENSIPLAGLLGYTVEVNECSILDFSLFADAVCESGKKESVETEIRKRLSYLENASEIGKRIVLSEIIYLLSDIEGLKYCDVNCDIAEGGVINCSKNQALRMTDITVNCHE